jgi:hypothetical protein
MSARQKTIRLDEFEQDVVIGSLNRVRTEQLKNNECDKEVSRLMLKIMKSPQKKARKRSEAR